VADTGSCFPLAEIERWVLGYGAQAEVLAPEELRRSVGETLAAGARRYARRAAISLSPDDARMARSRASGGALQRHGGR
jgi:hypothetical protein